MLFTSKLFSITIFNSYKELKPLNRKKIIFQNFQYDTTHELDYVQKEHQSIKVYESLDDLLNLEMCSKCVIRKNNKIRHCDRCDECHDYNKTLYCDLCKICINHLSEKDIVSHRKRHDYLFKRQTRSKSI